MNNLVTEFEGIKIGDTIHNNNESDYVVIAINPEEDRTLLLEKGTKSPFYVGAWGLQKGTNGNWYWAQGHYFVKDLFNATKYVMDIKEE